MNWLIGITVLFIVLVAACGVWMNAASESVDDTIDFALRATCYDTGFNDGLAGSLRLAPYDDSRCRELYFDGYGDGQAGNYAPPRE